jgi:ATP-dependent helicase HrpB
VDLLSQGPRGLKRAAQQLEGLARHLDPGEPPARDDSAIRRALLAGFPDRVARRREAGSPRVLLCSGTGAVLARESGVRDGELLLALDVTAGTGGGEALVRVASGLEAEWVAPTRRDVTHRFDGATGAVKAFERSWYQGLVLAERPVAPDPAASAPLLAEAVRERSPGPELAALERRAKFSGVPLDVGAVVELACSGCTRLADVDLVGAVPHATRAALDRGAPTHLALPSGRQATLDYREGGRVFAAVKLQELFGLAETPLVGPGRVPVVFELLAPSGRPVQTTSDLRSFWARGYPEVRRELRGRYPKHPWPEDPWSAEPTHRTRRRR